MKFPEYQTNRLVLRQLSEQDSERLFQLFSDPSVIEYYDMEAMTDRAQATRIIDAVNDRFHAKSGIRWGIALKGTGELIGTCGFNSWSEKMKSAVVGYDLMPNYWGLGFITEAVHHIVTQAFLGNLPCGELNRIQADTVPGNTASEKVLLKVGFKEEGLRRQSGYWKNQFHDLKCFGLLRNEYSACASDV